MKIPVIDWPITVAEAARQLKVSKQTIYSWVYAIPVLARAHERAPEQRVGHSTVKPFIGPEHFQVLMYLAKNSRKKGTVQRVAAEFADVFPTLAYLLPLAEQPPQIAPVVMQGLPSPGFSPHQDGFPALEETSGLSDEFGPIPAMEMRSAAPGEGGDHRALTIIIAGRHGLNLTKLAPEDKLPQILDFLDQL